MRRLGEGVNKAVELDLSIPYHLFRVGSRIYGFDAAFWNAVERSFRKVLLIVNWNDVRQFEQSSQTGCRLKVRVGHEEVLRDIEKIALRDAGPGYIEFLKIKIESLLIPMLGRKAEELGRDRVEAIQASFIARNILSEGRFSYLSTAYSSLRVRENGGRFETLEPQLKSYESLYRLDHGFRSGVRRAIAECIMHNRK
ncbi:MAG: hypothetical protein F7B20_01560 [Aeropyrum sp.]|nr:hypothetical protein [Aeropyrum sp.]